MRLDKFILLMVLVTVLALIYTHMQMKVFDLAYRNRLREGAVKELLEENGHIMYSLLQMKSSKYLGERLLKENPDMKFADSSDIVKVSTIKQPYQKDSLDDTAHLQGQQQTKSKLSFLPFGKQAEARDQK